MKRIPRLTVALLLAALLHWPPAAIPGATGTPTRENPLLVDKVARRVVIYSEVNARGVDATNPHWGVVSVHGSLADKAILKTYTNHLEFHDALLAIGARPGDNLTKDTVGIPVRGDRLVVTATWPGLDRELPLAEIFDDSAGKGFDIRFGGNRNMSKEAATGCVMCLESCWIAITSNARYPNISTVSRFLNPNSKFKGKADVLPGAGQPVFVIFRLAE